VFLRWLFVFLVLANLLFLLWHSTFLTEAQQSVHANPEPLNNIRLLAEMDSDMLKKRQAQDPPPMVCHYFSGFAQPEASEGLLALAAAEGLHAEVLSNVRVEDKYVIKVEMSDLTDSRQALIAFLRETRGIGVDPQELELNGLYVLGQYENRREAEKELQQVVLSGVAAYLVLEEVEETQYTVVVYAEDGRNLSSEINGLVASRYSAVKIEKKVCPGVARP